MKRTAWLGNLRKRLLGSRRRRPSRSWAPERLEDRTLLSVAAVLQGSELTVFSDSDDDILIRATPDAFGVPQVDVVVNGVARDDLLTTAAAQLSALRIVGGPGANFIDLTQVRAEQFSFTDPVTGAGLRILVEAGEGDDTILTTFDFNDSVFGGDGNDLINNTPMQPGPVFTMPPSQAATLLGTVPAAFSTQPLSIIEGTESAEFPSVAELTDASGTLLGVGTLISPRHVLTAAHVVDALAPTDGRFLVGFESIATQEIIIHPNYNALARGTDAANDIAILLLEREPRDIIPSPLFRGDPVVGQLLTLVGFGEGGDGRNGADGVSGIKRIGDSQIDRLSPTLLIRTFDDFFNLPPDSNTAPVDDGAPSFISVNSRQFVAGVFSSNTVPTGVIGDRAFDTRVDNNADWIDSVVALIFPPNPLGNLTLDGGDGADTVNGGDGNDSLLGGDGDDLLVPWIGDDTILAGDGDDSLDAERGNDLIDLGDGADIAFGGDGNDTINGGDGNDTILGESGDDSILGGRGADVIQGDGGGRLTESGSDTILGNAGDDTIVGGGAFDVLIGGSGNDVLDAGDQTIAIQDVVFSPEGDSNEVGQAVFNVVLSRPSPVEVTVDFQTRDLDAIAGLDYSTLTGTVTFLPGQTLVTISIDVLGDDEPEPDEQFRVELANAQNALVIDSVGVATIVDDVDGPVQTVLLDFDSSTNLRFDHFYTPLERNAIQARLEEDYAPFSVVFTQVRPIFGVFSTLIFNEPPPGGLADEIDFRNINLGLNATIDVNQLLGGFGGLPATTNNFIELSAKIAAHEMGHLMGLRHNDAFGPVGSGIASSVAPTLYNPPYPGPSSANESNNHIMGSPAATGETLQDAVNDQFFGARSAVKLSMFAFQGQVLNELMGTHATPATAQPIELRDLPVPNTELRGTLVGQVFDVQATSVLGNIDVAGELDLYAFNATQGDLINIEVMSTIFAGSPTRRFGALIDPILSVVDATGTPIPYFTGTAINDDGTDSGFPDLDSIIIDLTIPSTGEFFLQVQEATGMSTGGYELFVWTFEANDPVFLDSGLQTAPFLQVTLRGGNGNDIINGSDGPDLIVGNSGNDNIMGNAENDSIFAGSGEDTVQGGAGNDVVLGQGGDDTLEGSDGDDFVNGGAGVDTVFGDDSLGLTSGNDTLSGGARNDALFGGAGNDVIFGGAGRDLIDGGDNNDTLFGQGGADIIKGGAGEDRIVWRTDGDDTVDGGEGRDEVEVRGTNRTDRFLISQDVTTLQITEGNSTLSIGRDEAVVANTTEAVIINARGGFDRIDIDTINNVGAIHILINAGSGNDVVNGAGARVGNVALIIDGGTGADTLTGTGDGDLIFGRDGTDLIFGRGGNDTLFGGDDADTLNGQAGDDLLLGENRNDVLRGGSGNDSADGSTGNDTLDGGVGDDTLTGGFGRDVVNGMDGDDVLTGNDGADRLLGGLGNDSLDGGKHDDTLVGQAGDDTIFGDEGDDFINGNNGDDSIDGADGDDTIMGGMGDDFIAGNDGNDLINGQAGADIIVGGDGRDSIQGGSGNDILFGSLGNDALSGNAGSDTIDAGEGIDSINNPEARDRIFDNGREFPLTIALRDLFKLISQ